MKVKATRETMEVIAESDFGIEISEQEYVDFHNQKLIWNEDLTKLVLNFDYDRLQKKAKKAEELAIAIKKIESYDYFTNKWIEGELSQEKWEEVILKRKEFRIKINDLREELEEQLEFGSNDLD